MFKAGGKKNHFSLSKSITLTGDPKVDSEIGSIFIPNEVIFEASPNTWHCAKASCYKPKPAKFKTSPCVSSQLETGVYKHRLKQSQRSHSINILTSRRGGFLI